MSAAFEIRTSLTAGMTYIAVATAFDNADSGAYTLTMGSNYNGVPRPAVVLVRDGDVRGIRRRESVDDLLRYEEA